VYDRVIEAGERGSPLTNNRAGVGSYNLKFAAKWKQKLQVLYTHTSFFL